MSSVTYDDDDRLVIVVEDSGDVSETEGYDAGSESDDGVLGVQAAPDSPQAPDSTTSEDLVVEIRPISPLPSPSPVLRDGPPPYSLFRADGLSCLPTSVLQEIDIEAVPLDYSMHREDRASPARPVTGFYGYSEYSYQYPTSSRSRDVPQGGQYVFRGTTTVQTSITYHLPPSEPFMHVLRPGALRSGHGCICHCCICFPPLLPPTAVRHNARLVDVRVIVDPRWGYNTSPLPVIILRHKVRYWYPTTYTNGRNGYEPNECSYVGYQWFYSEYQGDGWFGNMWDCSQPSPPNNLDYSISGRRFDLNVLYDNHGPYWVEDIALPLPSRYSQRATATFSASATGRATSAPPNRRTPNFRI